MQASRTSFRMASGKSLYLRKTKTPSSRISSKTILKIQVIKWHLTIRLWAVFSSQTLKSTILNLTRLVLILIFHLTMKTDRLCSRYTNLSTNQNQKKHKSRLSVMNRPVKTLMKSRWLTRLQLLMQTLSSMIASYRISQPPRKTTRPTLSSFGRKLTLSMAYEGWTCSSRTRDGPQVLPWTRTITYAANTGKSARLSFN